ncbi:LuxR family transcriptional regulator [Streptomyces sp. GC420]|uniref:helix-turn-helix transcriptional regulator n=1 Tax=Streptomyces sp. GC420 TaxID=2697568 RepID=UPI0014151C2E|nr:LuxR family transcriptional regulator [Streptomyces sp. GC420]NBM20410.1 AAA family ATPase [Streptomyces sp. GC420]
MERVFEGPGRPRSGRVVGRGDVLAQAQGHLSRGGSLLLYGPAGIGKSTVLRVLAEEAEQAMRTADGADGTAGSSTAGATAGATAGDLPERPVTVLRCSATETESHLPFLALVDLLGLVADEVADRLPAPQRAALESALTGRAESSLGQDALALRLAVLSVLRALAARGPVLVVADDLQWMDPASAELLAFAARRVGGLPVRILGALRTDSDPRDQQERHLRAFPQDTLTLRVRPLTRPQVHELLADRGYTGLPRAVVRDIHRTSGGNPLFALELGRALTERSTPPRPGEPLPVPTSLRTLVLNRLGMLSAEARRTLLIASAGARPTHAMLHSAGRADAEAETRQAALLGLVETDGDGGAIRFAHPLISAALYAEATPEERRTAHAALSAAASDTIERARHLALATPGEDATVAERLAEAAAEARDRGAPSVATQLGLLAARHTPRGARPGADERRLQAAEDALTAGETELARSTAREVLGSATDPAHRVRAWMVVIDSAGQAMAEVDDIFPRALADAGDDPRLLAQVRYQLAWRALLVEGEMAKGREEAAQAAELAAKAGDRRTELLALTFKALNETLMGHPDAAATVEQALSEPQDPRVACDHNGPAYARFRWLVMSDRLDEARTAITALLGEARQRGMVESEAHFLRGLAETELRAGHCGPALDLAHESLRLAEDTGIGEGASFMCASLAEAAGGSVGRALTLAREAVRRAEEDGDLVYLSRALCAEGHAHLVGGDAQSAVRALRRVRELERDLGVTDPARGRWHGDLAEALVRIGEPGEAQELIDCTRASARRLGRESVLAVLDRAEALVVAARGDLCGAATRLAAARERLAGFGYRLEEARAVFSLAQVESERRDAAAARTALDEAARLFRRSKALPWLQKVGAAPAPEAATPPELVALASMERQVAALVLEGATNREIAASLFISVKTVEATLTRVYRKLGIRSRVDIVRLAAGRRAG